MTNLEEISASGINNNFTALKNELATKADKSYVDNNLALKASLNGSTTQNFDVANATTSTQAINKGQLDSELSAINSELSSLEGEVSNITADGYRFPDYANGVGKTWGTTHTATCDGWLYVFEGAIAGANRLVTLIIDGVSLNSYFNDNSGYSGSMAFIPISKNSTYRATSGPNTGSIIFFPAKGV